VEELYAKTISVKVVWLILRRTEKQHGISPRFAMGKYNVALNSLLEAQEKPWNKTDGMTPWMASTACWDAQERLSGREDSETTHQTIARLRNVTCPP